MIFIVRAEAGNRPAFAVKMTRRTPSIIPCSDGLEDFFCLGDPDAAQAAGLPVVPVHDGWYADDTGGGMAIWGQGLFWEVRDTPFTIKEACGPEAWPDGLQHDTDAAVNVRDVIFQGGRS
ncbi:MAG TPA: hypothetical protein DDZ81_09680 [Acetobacteraceae bacterium]|jgi:hypothetical protein|nr:hypothetical protein [Acetobacteraceae bacterium]